MTIFGESAGSFSVSALMASPLAQGLFQRAIGESGAFFSVTLGAKPLAEAEEADQKFADSLGAHSLEALRALPADTLLDAAAETRDDPILAGHRRLLPARLCSFDLRAREAKQGAASGRLEC